MRPLFLMTILACLALGAAPVKKLTLAYAPRDSYDMWLVGGFDKLHGWRPGDQLGGRVGARRYRIYTLNGDQGDVSAGKVVQEEMGMTARLERKLHRRALLVHGDRPDLPRDLAPGDVSDPKLNATLSRFLKVPSVRVTQAVKVDLDGDGQQETVVAASSEGISQVDPGPGNYSLAAVVRGSEVIPLALQTYPTDMPWDYHEVLAVANLDGTGPFEVVVHSEYYEGFSVNAYDLSGPRPRVLVGSSWGL